MPVGLSLALLLTAQASGAAPQPAQPVPTSAEKAVEAAKAECGGQNQDPNARDIVICAQRQEGYRLNPDIMEARREIRRDPGRLKTPGEKRAISDCGVGNATCQSAGINLVAAAITAGTMAARLAQGKEIGSMFVTDPHPDEYHLYLQAKHRREAQEALAAAEAAKAKAQAEAAKSSHSKPAPTAE